MLVEASRRHNMREAMLNEIVEKGPHCWERLLQDLRPYQIALQATLCELAQDGKLVHHGHLGHELLSGIGHVLRMVLTASLEYGLDQVPARGLGPTAAYHYIDQAERARTRRQGAVRLRLARPRQCALVVNLAQMSVSRAVTTIIIKQSQAGRPSSTDVGIGGTPFAPYLKKHRDETYNTG